MLVLAGAFLLLVASLLIGSFTTPELPPYQLGPSPAGGGNGTYTLDASRGDRWQRFRFAENRVVEGDGPWDIAFRRNHVITAPGAGARDLGRVSFDSLSEVPAEGYTATQGAGGGGPEGAVAGDTVNPGIGKWYSYSMLSHLLTSKHHLYAVRTADGDFVVLEVLAYYCQGIGAACYTVRHKKARPRV